MDRPVVKKILDAYWNWHLPVRVEDIAVQLGISISALNPLNPEHRGLSGLAEIRDGKKHIYYNSEDVRVRQRFTLAHELGHHILNHVTPQNPKFRDDVRSFSGNSIQWEERDANAFAAQLLIPEVAIEYLVVKEGISDISTLALKFDVSEAAMYYRLKNLGYLSY